MYVMLEMLQLLIKLAQNFYPSYRTSIAEIVRQ